jgi:photosystem II stability/assembly factor-like uncharacterized protein
MRLYRRYPRPLSTAVAAIMVFCLFGCSEEGKEGSEERKEEGHYAHDVLFLDASHFLVAGWSGPVFVSRDGGNSWKKSGSPVPLN